MKKYLDCINKHVHFNVYSLYEAYRNISLPSQIEGCDRTQAGRAIMSLSVAAVLLLLCVQRLHGSALPAVSSYEFTAYRMQQYNLVQQKHGRFRRAAPHLDW